MIEAAARAPDADDRELLARSAAGDQGAFAVLARRHAPSLRRFARGLAGASADDAVQVALVDAYRGAGGFRGEGSVRAWLFVLTRNAARRLGRRAQPTSPLGDEGETFGLGVAAGWGSDDPERAALRAERRELVARALERLDEDDRAVLLLRDLAQLDTGEAAEALGLGERALKSRLHRARLRLAAALRQMGTEEDAHG